MKVKSLIKLLVCLSVWLCGCGQVSGQNCVELFKKANILRQNRRYSEAIDYYKRVKKCGDASFLKDCNKWISWCRVRIPRLTISEKEVHFPFQGGKAMVAVSARSGWKIVGRLPDWCSATVTARGLVIQSVEQNNALQERTATLTVRSGKLSRKLKVVQEARPEYVLASCEELFLPAKESVHEVGIESNAEWKVAAFPSWCKVERDSTRIRIVAEANDSLIGRIDSIQVASDHSAFFIRVCQSAREEILALSLDTLKVPAKGGKYVVKVNSDVPGWWVSYYPNWCNVRSDQKDSLIRIRVKRNARTDEARQDSVTISTEHQSVKLQVEQASREAHGNIFRNVREKIKDKIRSEMLEYRTFEE